MYERLKSLYQAGRLTDAQLDSAVAKGWITAEQAAEIRASVNAPVDALIVQSLSE